jgi:xanthine dehydrogenase accessory factor
MRDGVPRTVPFELTERQGGLVCGGKVLVYIEPILPEPQLVILGAGHVGRALSRLGKFAGLRVIVAENRPEYATREALPEAEDVVLSEFGQVFSKVRADADTYIVVVTRGHNHDLEALKAALGTEARYVGLLGSRRKKALILRALREGGYGEEDLRRVVTPAGLPIGSLTPEEIAVSIIAQIIGIRRHSGATRFGHPSCGGLFEEDGEAETDPSDRRQAGGKAVS